MATIVFWIPGFAGHLHATLQMAGRLRERGHRVLYAGPVEAAARVSEQGFDFVPVAFARPFPGGGLRWSRREAGGPLARLREGLATLRRLRRETRELRRILGTAAAEADRFVARWRPDLLVFDPFLLMYSIPFHRHRIPTVALSTKPLLDPDPLVPPYTSGFIPGRSWPSRLRVELAWLGCRLRYRRYKLGVLARKLITGASPYDLARELAKPVGFPLRHEWDMRPLALDFRLRSTPEIVLLPRELELPRLRPLRQNVRYAGPCPSIDRREPPFPWHQVQRRRHLALCSFGAVDPTKNPAIPGLLRRVAEACGMLADLTLILSLGGNDPDAFGDLPPNVRPFKSVPQVEVLRQADLFICHGGANSLKESLMLGVPLLIFPMRNDQPGNAARVVFHGLGLRGDYRRDGAAAIARRVRVLLSDPAWRARAREMQRIFERYESEEVASGVLESFLRPAEELRDAF
jgi:UDP:flavonoid glycosyltransferase YjiC (YdhE family)